MTRTAVVFGIATLGTPEPPPDGDCAKDAIGSIALRKGIMNLIGSPLDSVWLGSWLAVDVVLSTAVCCMVY
jgi:hypothetical protein